MVTEEQIYEIVKKIRNYTISPIFDEYSCKVNGEEMAIAHIRGRNEALDFVMEELKNIKEC